MVNATRALLGKYIKGLASLTSKWGNREFYKGTGAIKGGRHTRKGKFIGDPTKKKWIIAPTNAVTLFKPYVAEAVRDVPGGVAAKLQFRVKP